MSTIPWDFPTPLFLIFSHRFPRRDLVSLYRVLEVQSVHGVQDLENTGKEMKEWHKLRPWGERLKEVRRWSGAGGRLHWGVEGPMLYSGRFWFYVEDLGRKEKI